MSEHEEAIRRLEAFREDFQALWKRLNTANRNERDLQETQAHRQRILEAIPGIERLIDLTGQSSTGLKWTPMWPVEYEAVLDTLTKAIGAHREGITKQLLTPPAPLGAPLPKPPRPFSWAAVKQRFQDHPIHWLGALVVTVLGLGISIGAWGREGWDAAVKRQEQAQPCRVHTFRIPASKWNTEEPDVYKCGATHFFVMVLTEGQGGTRRRFMNVIAQPARGSPDVALLSCGEGEWVRGIDAPSPLARALSYIDCSRPDETSLVLTPPSL